jgi:hypothetical protein
MPKKKKSPSPSIRNGRRLFFNDAAVDKVLAMLLTLASEVWGLRERMAALEAVAAARGMPLGDEVERYEFSDAQVAKLAQLRNEFIGGLFAILNEPAPGRKSRNGGKPRRRARRPK